MKPANKKQSGFLPMLKNVFRRNIASLILTQILTFAITIVLITSFLSTHPTHVVEITFEYSFALTTLFFISFIVLSFAVGYLLFRELFSKVSSDFLFSLPVRREACFNANMLFGLINIGLSYIISFAVTLFCVKSDTIFPSKFYIFDVSSFSYLILMAFLASAAIFAIFVLCASMAGRLWHYLALSYLAVAGVYNAAICLSNYADSIWGFKFECDYSFIVSPFSSGLVLPSDKLNNITAVIIALAVQFIVAYAAGLIVFRLRKAETAETSVFGKFLPVIYMTLFMLSVSFQILNSTNKLYVSVIAVLIVTVLITFMLTALFYRKLLNKSTITSFAASVVITAVVIVCIQFIPKASGYVAYVPEVSEVESVTVISGETSKDMNSMALLTDFYYDFYYDNHENTSYSISSDEGKSAVCELHKKMVSDEAKERLNDNETYSYDAVNSIKLEYKLKNGKSVVRSYYVNASIVNDALAAMLKTDECLDQIEPMNCGDDVLFVTLYNCMYDTEVYDEDYDFEYEEDSDGEEFVSDYTDGYDYVQLNDYQELFECLKKDIKQTADEDTLLLNNGFDPEYYETWDDDFYDYNNDQIFIISFYKFSDSATDEDKEKLNQMSPSEMLRYDINRVYESDYEVDYLLDSVDYYVLKTDNNTIKYFETLGYKYF